MCMSVTTQSTLIERNETEVCRTVLDDAPDGVLAVGLSADVIDGLLTVLTEREDSPTIRVLAAESVLKELVSDFTVASTIADFVASDVLSLRTATSRLDGPLLLTEDRVISIVSTGDRTAGLATDDDEFVETARSRYGDLWDDAGSFSLRTPPLSRVQETLDEEFGPDLQADFEQMRTALGTDRGDGNLDAVDISLLAAAKNEALLYDISTWGEDVGVASRATFSRKKNRLEETGLIDTEKVPIDVGRPRLRLLLGDERLRGADADELVSAASSILSAASS
jgi:predicted nucleic acid-binding protein